MGKGDVRGNETIDGMVRAEKLASRVYNITGTDFARGTLVAANSWDQTLRATKVVKADANVAGRRRPMGVCYSALNSGNVGFVRRCAYIDGLDTSGTTVGDPVYLSETAGAFVFVAPTAAGSDVVPVGRVAVVSASVGAIYFDLTAEMPAATSGNLGLSPGILSADATGRALMADGYFDATTTLAKFGTGSFSTAVLLDLLLADGITNAVLIQAILDGAFQADAATRALFADGVWNAAKLASAAVTPAKLDAASYFVVEQDFAGDATATLPIPHGKDVQGDATGDYVADVAAGVYRLLLAVTSEAEAAQLTWADQLLLDPTKGLIFEARVRINFAGAAFSADQRAVFGVCSAHANSEDSLDATTSLAWFRIEGTSLNLVLEGDDGTHDTDDQATNPVTALVDNTYVLLKIDFTTLAAVAFSVNGVAVGTVDLSSLTASTLLQPIFNMQRDAGTEIETLDVDWYRVYTTRA